MDEAGPQGPRSGSGRRNTDKRGCAPDEQAVAADESNCGTPVEDDRHQHDDGDEERSECPERHHHGGRHSREQDHALLNLGIRGVGSSEQKAPECQRSGHLRAIRRRDRCREQEHRRDREQQPHPGPPAPAALSESPGGQAHEGETEQGRGDPHGIERRRAMERTGRGPNDPVEHGVVLPRARANEHRAVVVALGRVAVVVAGIGQRRALVVSSGNQVSRHANQGPAPVDRRIRRLPLSARHCRCAVDVVELVNGAEGWHGHDPQRLEDCQAQHDAADEARYARPLLHAEMPHLLDCHRRGPPTFLGVHDRTGEH